MITFQFHVTEKDIDRYGAVSGDMNPLHFDAAFAKENGFSGKVAHGMLSMAKLLSNAAKECLEPTQMIEKYEVTFIAPVYSDSVVEVSISNNGKQFRLIGKSNGETVLKGSFFIYTDFLMGEF